MVNDIDEHAFSYKRSLRSYTTDNMGVKLTYYEANMLFFRHTKLNSLQNIENKISISFFNDAF